MQEVDIMHKKNLTVISILLLISVLILSGCSGDSTSVIKEQNNDE